MSSFQLVAHAEQSIANTGNSENGCMLPKEFFEGQSSYFAPNNSRQDKEVCDVMKETQCEVLLLIQMVKAELFVPSLPKAQCQ